MKVVFRADASVKIGTGHVMRCLTLAGELSRHGHHCRFICRNHVGHLGELIASKGYECTLLTDFWSVERRAPKSTSGHHADWLGVCWRQDAEQTREVLTSLRADWLVVDHYALDARWERETAAEVGRLMVIDDLADRSHQADLLLDQNALGIQIEQRYLSRVNSNCKLLLGPEYALLGPEYCLLANALPERDGHVLRVAVFVGGSDPHHLTERYLEALSAPEFRHLLVDVVIGNNHPSPEAVSDLVLSRNGTRLFSGVPSLSALMIRADLMLGAGGATNWERMCLGLTAIVVSVAGNQGEINLSLAGRSLIQFLGKAESVTLDGIKASLSDVLNNADRNAVQSEAMRNVVDGAGAGRVTRIMMEAQTDAPT